MKINNPVLRGFSPDPNMCYVEGKYYIVTSTFQWYPGIAIYASSNLVDWDLVGYPLTSNNGFDLRGVDDSAGIWAPQITYINDKFHVTYTIVKSATGVYYDMDNYIVTCDTIEGEWSNPIQIHSGCFDPFLYQDDDKLYCFAKIVDHRYEPTNDYIDNYSGITIQELDSNDYSLIGGQTIISHGTGLGGEEGPQMVKRNGYYYLTIAEGGTEYNHRSYVFRSENIRGPYDLSPYSPLIQSRKEDKLQKAGHASLVKGHDDNWFISYICARPIMSRMDDIKGKLCCPLGRETAIDKVEWIDDWPRVINGNYPKEEVEIYNICDKQSENDELKTSDDNYSNEIKLCSDGKLFDNAMSLRYDNSEYYKCCDSSIEMKGKDSLMSKFDTNMLAHRIHELNGEISVKVDYEPTSYLQCAGISLYYDTENHLNIVVTHDEKFGKCIKIECLKHGKYSTLGVKPISVNGDVNLKVELKRETVNVYVNEILIEFEYSSAYLSDDFILMKKPSFFTGMMCGIFNSDLLGTEQKANFINYQYKY